MGYLSQRPGENFNSLLSEQEHNDDDTDSLTSNTQTTKNGHSRLGRRGDPRMHRAVAARLAQPSLSLIEALRMGGFDYPEDANDDQYVLDNDTVSLGQRKNQLSRRCRLAKQQANGTPVKSKQRRTYNFEQEPKTRGQKRALVLSQEAEEEDEQATVVQQMAKFHPQYHPIILPPSHVPIGVLANHSYDECTLAQKSPTATWPAPGPSVTETLNINSKPLPSGVAVASLSATASSVGLTLEQLAVSLSSTTNLARVLDGETNPNVKQQLALNLFRAECGPLYQRCMLLAGYDTEDTKPTSMAYKEFAYKAWSAEGKRLESQVGRMEDATCPNDHVASKEAAPSEKVPAMTMNLGHQQQRSHSLDLGESKQNEAGCCGPITGRHIHRLDDKCGHQAILHKPPGRTPHIDFVVNGKVECYEGLAPSGPCIMWPSRYNCDELECSTAETNPNAHKVGCECDKDCTNSAGKAPKEYSLSDIDLDGKEWDKEFFQDNQGNENSLAGLMQLYAGTEDGKIAL